MALALFLFASSGFTAVVTRCDMDDSIKTCGMSSVDGGLSCCSTSAPARGAAIKSSMSCRIDMTVGGLALSPVVVHEVKYSQASVSSHATAAVSFSFPGREYDTLPSLLGPSRCRSKPPEDIHILTGSLLI